MKNAQIVDKISRELSLAVSSQKIGNQGRARVCARRAAGWAVQAYLIAQGESAESPSALEHMKYLAAKKNLSPRIYKALHRLTIKLEKDSLEEEAYYPIEDVDLVQEAHWLAEELLQTKIPLSENS